MEVRVEMGLYRLRGVSRPRYCKERYEEMFTPLVIGFVMSAVQDIDVVGGGRVNIQDAARDSQTGGLADRWPDLRDKRGNWRLIWDDKVDGKLESEDKHCEIFFVIKGEKVSGNMTRMPGKDRRAAVVGTFDALGRDEIGLLSFRQVEGPYVCSYHIFMNGAGAVGTWTDTHGRSGDFILLKYQ